MSLVISGEIYCKILVQHLDFALLVEDKAICKTAIIDAEFYAITIVHCKRQEIVVVTHLAILHRDSTLNGLIDKCGLCLLYAWAETDLTIG